MEKDKQVISALMTAMMAVALMSVSTSARAADTSSTGMEKCYGIAKAGQNDCDTGDTSCTAKSMMDADPNYWVYVPKGICNKIAGGMLKTSTTGSGMSTTTSTTSPSMSTTTTTTTVNSTTPTTSTPTTTGMGTGTVNSGSSSSMGSSSTTTGTTGTSSMPAKSTTSPSSSTTTNSGSSSSSWGY